MRTAHPPSIGSHRRPIRPRTPAGFAGRTVERESRLCVSVSPWLVSLCVLGILCLGSACRRASAPRLPPLTPQISGSLAIAGLAAPVRIVRDTWGVPHIYAAIQNDLFVAQGFVQAQDRLFQMDLWRRSSQGRLSEVLGPNFIERDAMTRRMQYRGDLEAEWASYGPDTKAIVTAFVRGVNAWVAIARERPPEEFVLAGWQPEAWAPEDLLNRSDAFTASEDALDEVFRARLTTAVGAARARLLLVGDRAIEIPAGIEPASVPDLVADAIRRVGTPPFFLGLAAPVTEGTVRVPPSAPAASGDRRPAASDARQLDHPSLRYLVQLNAPGWNVIGATAPWHPGVAEGHNDRIAWSAQPFEADTQDVYVEKLNPANPRQVEDNARWVDIEARKDWIAVRGRKTPVDYQRETTRHGVIVASDLARQLAFTVRWSGSEPGAAAELAAPALDRASSSAEFRTALARWKMPARRFTFAIADGRQESQIAAAVPVRRGWNGAFPVPGWTGTYEWSGWTTPAPAPPPKAAAPILLASVRRRADRADALLQRLAAAASAPDSLTAQRAAIVDALAEALRERMPSAGEPVLFAHPLGITTAARGRFNVAAAARIGAAAETFAIRADPADWDRSTAINAPGQSGWADSANFADLAKLWSQGQSFPLAFSESAVQAHAAATLTLTPR
jgi:acyl-homoserine lactone acylase PvdQ